MFISELKPGPVSISKVSRLAVDTTQSMGGVVNCNLWDFLGHYQSNANKNKQDSKTWDQAKTQ